METNKITRALGGWLDEYRKMPEIIDWLKFMHIEITEREFSTYVELYRQEDHEFYLESCSKGYRFTRDKECIQRSCYQRIGKAVSMLKNAKRDLKMCGDRNQLTLIDNFINDYESEIKIAEGVI